MTTPRPTRTSRPRWRPRGGAPTARRSPPRSSPAAPPPVAPSTSSCAPRRRARRRRPRGPPATTSSRSKPNGRSWSICWRPATWTAPRGRAPAPATWRGVSDSRGSGGTRQPGTPWTRCGAATSRRRIGGSTASPSTADAAGTPTSTRWWRPSAPSWSSNVGAPTSRTPSCGRRSSPTATGGPRSSARPPRSRETSRPHGPLRRPTSTCT